MKEDVRPAVRLHDEAIGHSICESVPHRTNLLALLRLRLRLRLRLLRWFVMNYSRVGPELVFGDRHDSDRLDAISAAIRSHIVSAGEEERLMVALRLLCCGASKHASQD
jgi:hypothetical protein